MTDQNTNAISETDAKNDKRHGDFMKQVGKLGEEAALGKDSLPKLAHAVVRAAADGVIDADKAGEVYEKYMKSESKKSIHEKGGVKANVSKLRQLIAMGCMTTIDPVDVMQQAFDAREAMIADDHKVKAAYAFYVDVARAQQNTDQPLSQETLEEMARKDDPKAKDVEGELKKVFKILEGLVTGENRDNLKDTDELTEAAFHSVKERLEKLHLMQRTEELRQKAKALGYELA